MVQLITAYIATAVVFLAVDYVWLTQVATRFYFDRIGHLLMDKPNLAAAGAFYIIYVVGIVVFAVAPAFEIGKPCNRDPPWRSVRVLYLCDL